MERTPLTDATLTIFALAAAFVLIWLLPTPPALRGIANYLPLHIALEGFSIIVAMLVFGVSWNAYSSERPGNVIIIACAMLAVGLIDFVHMLSFKGMPELITPSGPEKAINFWLAARFLAALALLAAAMRPWTPLSSPGRRHVLLATAIALTALISWVGLYHQEAFPHTFVEGEGLTPLKIAAEYLIVVLLIVPAALFWRDARRGAAYDATALFAAAAISILSELSFTLYKDVTDIFNLLGHVYKVLAYGYIYRALFVASLRQPFELLQQQVALREEAQEEARAASLYSRSLIEASLDPLVTISPEGKITDVNEATVAATGVPRQDLIGTDFSNYFTEPHKARSGYREVFENGFVTDYPLTILHRGGRLTDVLYNASLYHDQGGAVLGVFAAARDVTERKRAETNARKLAAIVASSDDAIISATLDGRISTWNAGAERLYGYRAKEIIGSPILTLVPPERAAEENDILERVRAGEHVSHYTTERLRSDASRIDVSLTISPVRDDAGTIVGISKTARDITERKRAEQAIQKLNLELEQRIAERTAQLAAANEELEAFAYSASHDLRAPLQTIDGFSRALEEDYGDTLDAVARDYLRRIRAAAQHMAGLTDALLKLSRLTRGDMSLEQVDLSAMARAVAEHLRAQDAAREVAFDIAAGATAHGDPRLLGAVLENLLGNAWKFTSRHPRARIEFGVADRAAERVYYVRDDGAGFDMERAQKLFAPFQRLHTTSAFPGSGIGLALVNRIIRRHGGRVWAEAAQEKGATFYFTIPDVPSGAACMA